MSKYIWAFFWGTLFICRMNSMFCGSIVYSSAFITSLHHLTEFFCGRGKFWWITWVHSEYLFWNYLVSQAVVLVQVLNVGLSNLTITWRRSVSIKSVLGRGAGGGKWRFQSAKHSRWHKSILWWHDLIDVADGLIQTEMQLCTAKVNRRKMFAVCKIKNF